MMAPFPEDKLPDSDKRSPLRLPPRVGDADPRKTARIWDLVQRNVHKAHGPHRPSYLTEMSSRTAILPYHWDRFPPDFVKYLQQELFDTTMTGILIYQRIINQCSIVVPLYPLSTTGDGNCLLHAISLALWGVEDTDLRLRGLLHSVMKGEFADANEFRWKRERNRFDTMHIPGSGFRYNTKEWSAEWDIVVDISSPERRIDQTMGLPYECLEEFHIFIMANILRRPIVILAEDMWRDATGRSLQPLNYCGIYLPLAWDPEDCCRFPIILGYHQMHFTPLVCTAPLPGKPAENRYVVPLESARNPLSVHFLAEAEDDKETELLQRYLHLELLCLEGGPVNCARLSTELPREELDVFGSYLKLAEMRYRMYVEEEYNPGNAEMLKAAGVMSARSSQQLNEKMATVGKFTPGELLPERQVPIDVLGGIESHSPAASCVKTKVPPCPAYEDVYGSHPKVYPAHVLNHPPQKLLDSVPVEDMYLPQPIYSRQATPACATTGCPYFTAVPSDQYCDSCSKARSNVGKEDFEKCLTPSCLNGGQRVYSGYCKVCFEQSTFMNEVSPSALPSSVSSRENKIVIPGPSSNFLELQARGPVTPDVPFTGGASGNEMDMQKSHGANLNTNVIDKFEVGSKKCLTPDCEFTGNPQCMGMCSRCFHRKMEETETAAYQLERTPADAGRTESVAALLSGSPPREILSSVGKHKCLMPECQLTGRPDKEDLCSGCFQKQTELLEHTNMAASPKARGNVDDSRQDEASSCTIPTSPGRLSEEMQQRLWQQAKPAVCLSAGCEMYAHPSQNGLCSKCFKDAEGDRSSPHSPKRVSKPVRTPRVTSDQPKGTFRPIATESLHFTVKKNMCANPGCNGVRVQLGDGEVCHMHHLQRSNRGGKRTPPTSSSFAATPAALPYSLERARPTAPPPSVLSNQSELYAPTTLNQRQKQTSLASPNKAPKAPGIQVICKHPKCSNPAVPPHYAACSECLEFVEKMKAIRLGVNPGKLEARMTPSVEDEVAMATQAVLDSDELPVENLKNLDVIEKTSPGIKDKFQFDHIERVQCQTLGGCPFKLFGDPSYGDLCSKCFDRDVVAPYQSSNSSSAPMKNTVRQPSLPPRSKSDVIVDELSKGTAKYTTSRPSNYKRCASHGCRNQANPQILDGLCNKCYPAYRSSDTPPREKKVGTSKTQNPSSSRRGPSGARQGAKGQELYKTVTGGTAVKCLSKGCQNFGNSHCKGYCNGCFVNLGKGDFKN